MDCPVCENVLVERNGKFGPFICCPKGNHGTFSIQGTKLYFKGEIGKVLRNQRTEDFYSRMQLESIDSGVAFQPTLTQLMNQQMTMFGYNGADHLTQLAEFAMGDPETMWDDEERNNPEHWWNQRPY